MTLTLTINAERWRAHQRTIQAEVPGLIPVIKGNGYGFGLGTLAAEAARLGVAAVAVGIAQEVDAVRAGGWDGDIVVLNPWRPFDTLATSQLSDPRIIATVSRPEDLRELGGRTPRPRVILELLTSMKRHGLAPSEVPRADIDGVTFEGWACHLPKSGDLEEAHFLSATALGPDAAEPLPTFWYSHLSVGAYGGLEYSGGKRMRVGTRLWLGDKQAYSTTGHVLDVHRIKKGERLGYHQHKAPKDGFIVVVSGGTSHGIALQAPTSAQSLKARGVTVAEGVLDALGRSLSPFTIGGKKRPFAEPPHMHSSMVFVPGDNALVKVGDEVPVTTRMTTTTPDEIRWA